MTNDKLVRSLKTQTEAGLTLVEVIVAMLVASLCLGTALQGYVAAVSVKAKAKQLNKAIEKIDADAETIRQMAQGSTGSCGGNYAQALMSRVVATQGTTTTAQATQSATTPDQGGAELGSQSSYYHHYRHSRDFEERSSSTKQSSSDDEASRSTAPVVSNTFPTNSSSTQPQSDLIASADLPPDYELEREMQVDPSTPKVLKVAYYLTRPAASTTETDSAESHPLAPAASADETVGETRVTLAQLSLSVMPSDALRCP
jgi:type II secretory pathway pseudopilin PulG